MRPLCWSWPCMFHLLLPLLSTLPLQRVGLTEDIKKLRVVHVAGTKGKVSLQPGNGWKGAVLAGRVCLWPTGVTQRAHPCTWFT